MNIFFLKNVVLKSHGCKNFELKNSVYIRKFLYVLKNWFRSYLTCNKTFFYLLRVKLGGHIFQISISNKILSYKNIYPKQCLMDDAIFQSIGTRNKIPQKFFCSSKTGEIFNLSNSVFISVIFIWWASEWTNRYSGRNNEITRLRKFTYKYLVGKDLKRAQRYRCDKSYDRNGTWPCFAAI